MSFSLNGSPPNGVIETTTLAPTSTTYIWTFTTDDFLLGDLDVQASDGTDYKTWRYTFSACKITEEVAALVDDDPTLTYSKGTSGASSWIATVGISEDEKLYLSVTSTAPVETITWIFTGRLKVMQPDPVE